MSEHVAQARARWSGPDLAAQVGRLAYRLTLGRASTPTESKAVAEYAAEARPGERLPRAAELQ